MKHIILIVLGLFSLNAAEAQYQSFFRLSDTLTRPSHTEIADTKPDIGDTLKCSPHRIDFDRTFSDTREKDGALSLTFDIHDSGKFQYAFPLHLSRQVTPDISFSIEWAIFRGRDESQTWTECDLHQVFIKGDTVFTIIYPAETGGTTPEGQKFSFTGDNISKIESRTKYVLSIDQGIAIDRTYRNMWTERITNFESQWVRCDDGKSSYTLPIVDKIDIDPEQFNRIKTKAIAIQKRHLFDDYDSIVNVPSWPGGRAYRISALKELKEQLKPNLDDAQSFSEMYLFIELSYFITEVKVHLKSGEIKHFVHLATYEAAMP